MCGVSSSGTLAVPGESQWKSRARPEKINTRGGRAAGPRRWTFSRRSCFRHAGCGPRIPVTELRAVFARRLSELPDPGVGQRRLDEPAVDRRVIGSSGFRIWAPSELRRNSPGVLPTGRVPALSGFPFSAQTGCPKCLPCRGIKAILDPNRRGNSLYFCLVSRICG